MDILRHKMRGEDGDLNYEMLYVFAPMRSVRNTRYTYLSTSRVVSRDKLGNRSAENGEELDPIPASPEGLCQAFSRVHVRPLFGEDYCEAWPYSPGQSQGISYNLRDAVYKV